VNARYRHNLTALMWAAASNSSATVEVLLQRGADVSARDDRGKTALAVAEGERNAEIAGLLRAECEKKGGC
jgi:uncharacterized protein